jgi:hypothetical protein
MFYKGTAAVLAVVGAVAIIVLHAHAQIPTTTTAISTLGRYQLQAAETESIGSNNEIATHRGLYRIDTQTGQTWLYAFLTDKNGVTKMTWIPISN